MPKASTDRLPELEPARLIGDRLVVVALPADPGLPGALANAGARDVLALESRGVVEARRRDGHVAARYTGAGTVDRNNCTVAILHGRAAFALASRKALARFDTILVPLGPELVAAALALARFRRRNRLAVAGRTRLGSPGAERAYLVLESRVASTDRHRQYGPAGLKPLDIVRKLEGLDYVVLRWSKSIEAGTHAGDIDLLVSPASAEEVTRRFASAVATVPLDVYTEDGSGGYGFNRAPYFVPHMARRILDAATVTPKGVRVTSPQWQYLSFAYHLLFHVKSRRVPPGTNAIGPETFADPKYQQELERLAAAAGAPRPATFDDIEAALKRAGAFPGIDLIGFYSNKNPFLRRRYCDGRSLEPGLATFFVRDFGRGLDPVADIRAHLAARFSILAEGPLAPADRDAVVRGARGGNWSDPEAPDGTAAPVYWFVCWDAAPLSPRRATRRRYPRLDNENIALKHTIRTEIGDRTRKPQRLVHASDNTAEALEHVALLGLSEHPEIAPLRARLEKAPGKDPAPAWPLDRAKAASLL